MDRKVIHKRIRARVKGTEERPRLSVFRSNQHIYAQIIDDEKRITLCSASDIAATRERRERSSRRMTAKKSKGDTKTDAAKSVGLEIAKKAKEKKVEFAVFDRGGFRYHGRIKAVAEGAREGGLKF